jgi:hypothetical protein
MRLQQSVPRSRTRTPCTRWWTSCSLGYSCGSPT